MNLKSLVVHAYRGIPEVHSWSYYTKHNHHWSVCGYNAEGSAGIPALEDAAPDTGIRGTTRDWQSYLRLLPRPDRKHAKTSGAHSSRARERSDYRFLLPGNLKAELRHG